MGLTKEVIIRLKEPGKRGHIMRDFNIDLIWAKLQIAITGIGGWLGYVLGGMVQSLGKVDQIDNLSGKYF